MHNLAADDPFRVDSEYQLGRAYQVDGQVKRAVELLEHVVAVDAKIYIEEHPNRLTAQHELTSVYQADGQVKKVVELLEHVVAVRTRVQAEEHPHQLAS